MAAGVFIFPNKAKLNFFSATNLANPINTFKMALVASSWTPSNTTDEVWADVSANEISAGSGYTAGGITLVSATLAQSGGTVTFDCADPTWSASGGSISAWRYGVVYASGTLNGKLSPIVGHFLGDSTPADIPATANGQVLTIQINANGIMSAS